jgi:hypothetical protein
MAMSVKLGPGGKGGTTNVVNTRVKKDSSRLFGEADEKGYKVVGQNGFGDKGWDLAYH